MKKGIDSIRFILAFILLFLPIASLAEGVMEIDDYYLHTYDRFTKTHSYSWTGEAMEIDKDDQVIAHLAESAIIVESPEETSFDIALIFRHVDDSGDYDFSKCGNVNWLVNNKVITPKRQAQISNEHTHFGADVLYNMMSESDFKFIMNSKKTEYRVCAVNEYELEDETKQGMKRIYANYLKNKNTKTTLKNTVSSDLAAQAAKDATEAAQAAARELGMQ